MNNKQEEFVIISFFNSFDIFAGDHEFILFILNCEILNQI